MNANSALSKAEESAAPQSAPAQEGADVGVSVAAAKKIQKLEASNVADKNKALRNAEAKSEGEKMLAGAKLAAQEAALASMKTKLKGHTQAVARANAEAAKLVSQLQNTEMKSAQADIKSKLQTAREEAASEHHAVEGLVIKIAEAKIEMKHTEAEADN